jgi:integrase
VAKTRYLTQEAFRLVYERLDRHRVIVTSRSGNPFTMSFAPGTDVAEQRQTAQDLLVALTFSGGRWSEVASLRWDRIVLERRVIRLWGSKTSGKKNSERLVGMPDLLHSMLSRRWAERKNGASLADIQSALGHSTLAMTMRYAHLLQAESANKLATIMNGVMK